MIEAPSQGSPLMSILVPTHNRAPLLRRALESAARQTFDDYEILVIDDGEGAAQTVSAFLAQRPSRGAPCRVIDNRRRGQVAARNLGAAQAQGQIIVFLDDDDHWGEPDYLAKIAAAWRAGAQATFASGRIIVENAELENLDEFPFVASADANSIRIDNTILVSGFAFARALATSQGPFDQGLPYYWDWDWYLRLFANEARFADLGACGILISARPDTVSSPASEARRRENLDRLAAKHSLGNLVLRNHESIARERRALG